ncbi:MAG: DNA translocase FtsK 4TM domain-containing protein [Thermodesulfobacteriota bacterium]
MDAKAQQRFSRRQEIVFVLFFFLILFATGSLFTFSMEDPSLLHSGSAHGVRNLFGVAGSQFSGLLIFLFGLGAFWAPLLLFFLAWHLWNRSTRGRFAAFLFGSFLLAVFSGSLATLARAGSETREISVFGLAFPAGGILGDAVKELLTALLNPGGAFFFLFTLFLVSLIAATGLSLVRTSYWTRTFSGRAFRKFQSRWILFWERRKKARRRAEKKAELVSLPAPKPPRIKKVTKKPVEPPAKQKTLPFSPEIAGETVLPPVSLLDDPGPRPPGADKKNLEMQSRLLEKKLGDFGVNGQVVEVSPGPVITTFEYEPAAGVKINKITSLSDDLALVLRATSVRIIGPIPGKAAVGIEVPNSERELVHFKEVVSAPEFADPKSKLTLCLGKDIVGNPTVSDLAKMPHLLIAGATGSGKSVALNAMIASLLYKRTPDEVKFVMVDPKRIELSNYDGIPHLICPVVTDVKKATNALFWAVREMERRYEAMAGVGARNISGYNQKMAQLKEKRAKEPPPPPPDPESGAPPPPPEPEPEPLPFVVVVIDELADLMMVASRDVEVALARLAQMARAAGIHLILATQRPSVDVLTGTIKANFPTRIAFQVSSKIDSRTIIDGNGAEALLGSGDMLFMPPGAGKIQRLHGAFISDEELSRVLSFVRQQAGPRYDNSVTEAPPGAKEDGEPGEEEYDEKYDEAVAIVTETRQASISMIQRKLRIGYNRAARIIELMEREGVVGPSDGVKPREVLVRAYDE